MKKILAKAIKSGKKSPRRRSPQHGSPSFHASLSPRRSPSYRVNSPSHAGYGCGGIPGGYPYQGGGGFYQDRGSPPNYGGGSPPNYGGGSPPYQGYGGGPPYQPQYLGGGYQGGGYQGSGNQGGGYQGGGYQGGGYQGGGYQGGGYQGGGYQGGGYQGGGYQGGGYQGGGYQGGGYQGGGYQGGGYQGGGYQVGGYQGGGYQGGGYQGGGYHGGCGDPGSHSYVVIGAHGYSNDLSTEERELVQNFPGQRFPPEWGSTADITWIAGSTPGAGTAFVGSETPDDNNSDKSGNGKS
ncbi:loricrin-like [Raphanus sativus]|uniref:Glycine-rich cell wall structural protein 1.8 n=1 Tax=Raphanus sativus TaxID=3726 RepID=A0A6J0M0W2_RAPSA|nr:glycine-rich cell wall structural protein 1.8 [Raphanus sativus]KAJ4911154.1 loricrin-like [Raphanus sativus]